MPLTKRDPRLLYTIILYSFNQQIRFNGDYNFNNPVGMRWFNDKILEKLISFSRVIKEMNVEFINADYTELTKSIDKEVFFYLDPPYRLTTGSYNDGKRGFKGWGIEEEARLLKFLDKLNHNNIYFMMSYVIEHKGKTNEVIKNWIKSNNYRLIVLNEISGVLRKEILVLNYNSKDRIINNTQQSIPLN